MRFFSSGVRVIKNYTYLWSKEEFAEQIRLNGFNRESDGELDGECLLLLKLLRHHLWFLISLTVYRSLGFLRSIFTSKPEKIWNRKMTSSHNFFFIPGILGLIRGFVVIWDFIKIIFPACREREWWLNWVNLLVDMEFQFRKLHESCKMLRQNRR